MGIASLILGIVALILGIFVAGFGWVGIVLAAAGIVLGALGRRDPAQAGIATAGMVCSIVALGLVLIVWLACMSVVGCTACSLRSLF